MPVPADALVRDELARLCLELLAAQGLAVRAEGDALEALAAIVGR